MKKLESLATKVLLAERKMYAAQADGKRIKYKWFKYKYKRAKRRFDKWLRTR